MLLKKKTSFTFETNATSILGTVNGHKAEYIPSVSNDGDFISYATTYGDTSERGLVRWQEDGYEYAFVGDMELDSLIQLGSELIGKEVTFVIKDREGHEFQPDIKVEVDLVVEENTQKGVDRGSSPWKLDPAYVASVEASILMSPDGIVGDASVAYEDVEVIYNDGINAIAEINLKDSMTKKIYMEKLIRRDETGIWTMVGYDIIN